MIEYTYKHSTKSGPKTVYMLSCEILTEVVNSHVFPDSLAELCRNGCINYNKKWCCPPNAKPFNILSKSFGRAIITCMYLHTDEFSHVQNKYLRIKAANMVLKKLSNRLSKEVEQALNGHALLNGSCNLCRPCNYKISLPCKRPEQMRYSMEATGINVENLLKEVFEFELQWYTAKSMPTYTSVVSCVLHNNMGGFDESLFTNKSFAELSCDARQK